MDMDKPTRAGAMRLWLLPVLAIVSLGGAFAQSAGIPSPMPAGLTLLETGDRGIVLEFRAGAIDFKTIGDSATLIATQGTNGYNHRVGSPMLPEYHRLIQVPTHATLTTTLLADEQEQHPLPLRGKPLLRVPPTRLKNGETVENETNTVAINDTEKAMVSVEEVGVLRGKRIVRLTLRPVAYNTEDMSVTLHHFLRVAINFGYDGEQRETASESKQYTNSLGQSQAAEKYVVVAPTRFAESLRPLIKWKREEGYQVVEYYTDIAHRDSIRALLKAEYDNATATDPAPTFVLLAGDQEDIPQFLGQHRISGLDVHRTDLYYAEYTGDNLPDALLGRLSVSNTAELDAVVAKTIAYEKGQLSQNQYLAKALLVAGKEERDPAPTVTNGQVNYLKTLLLSQDTTIDTLCYYNPQSDTQEEAIRNHLSEGVGLVNYTAHCNTSGWMNPWITSSDIDTMTANGRYYLSINNCCKINAIIGNCMGEHLLRKAGGGAIGVVGASNETLWEEDYAWSIGAHNSLETNPQYDPESLGAFDRLLHCHGESADNQALTQSQLVLAGNWAVEESGSQYAGFYWEIYSLLGDPSLMPYIGIPGSLQLELQTPLRKGDSLVALQGTPHCRVAATQGDTLLGICTLDSNGTGTILCRKALGDSLLLTATKQFHIPLQEHYRLNTNGIVPVERTATLTIVPNPAHDEIRITSTGAGQKPCSIDLFDCRGRKVGHIETAGPETEAYPIGHLHSGVYYVVLDNGTEVVVKKLVKL